MTRIHPLITTYKIPNDFFENFKTYIKLYISKALKIEFDKNDNSLFYSPKPDIFLTQGIKYFKRLKKIFPYKKVYPVGSFKYELADYKFNKIMVKKKAHLIK